LHKSIENLMMKAIYRLTFTCEIVTQKISEGLDHPLPLRERVKIRVHVLFCKFCNRYEKQLLALHRAFQNRVESQFDEEDGEGLSDEARQIIKRALKDKSKSS